MIQIIPAIDIIGGKCVRLSQGDYDRIKVYDASPVDMAKEFADCGVCRIHLVDLDGAKASKPLNLKTLEQIASSVDLELEWGGGLSNDQALRDIFNAGATCGIIGSAAVLSPEKFSRWLKEFSGQRMILGADVRGHKVAVKGWAEDSEQTIEQVIRRFLPDGLTQVICTDISRDGMLSGPNIGLYQQLQEAFPEVVFTVSGGVAGPRDIEALAEAGMRKVITGKAIYENRISLSQIRQWATM